MEWQGGMSNPSKARPSVSNLDCHARLRLARNDRRREFRSENPVVTGQVPNRELKTFGRRNFLTVHSGGDIFRLRFVIQIGMGIFKQGVKK
jgi:hypothetical protein